jgi:hypothetical protein
MYKGHPSREECATYLAAAGHFLPADATINQWYQLPSAITTPGTPSADTSAAHGAASSLATASPQLPASTPSISTDATNAKPELPAEPDAAFTATLAPSIAAQHPAAATALTAAAAATPHQQLPRMPGTCGSTHLRPRSRHGYVGCRGDGTALRRRRHCPARLHRRGSRHHPVRTPPHGYG